MKDQSGRASSQKLEPGRIGFEGVAVVFIKATMLKTLNLDF